MDGKVKEGKISHDTGQDVKKDICNMITHRIKFPEMIIDGITKDPDGLKSISLLKCEYFLDPFPIQIPDGGILVNHPVVPVCKLVSQRIEVENPNQYQNSEADDEYPNGLSSDQNSEMLKRISIFPSKQHMKRNRLPGP
jgi:hypothetical protein